MQAWVLPCKKLGKKYRHNKYRKINILCICEQGMHAVLPTVNVSIMSSPRGPIGSTSLLLSYIGWLYLSNKTQFLFKPIYARFEAEFSLKDEVSDCIWQLACVCAECRFGAFDGLQRACAGNDCEWHWTFVTVAQCRNTGTRSWR